MSVTRWGEALAFPTPPTPRRWSENHRPGVRHPRLTAGRRCKEVRVGAVLLDGQPGEDLAPLRDLDAA